MAEVSSQTYKRLCDNWLDDFLKWTLPRSEAPETFIVWTGLFILASALRRHVKVPKRLLGSWEAAPNLYILFIAKAGRARKTTTALYTEELMEELTHITKAPELITKESLLTTLVKSDDSAMSILAPEFGEFMVKSGPEMYGFLTNMYDGKRRIVGSTLSRGVELVERPCINLLGATTPEWVAANMPADVIGGGFASRVVFVFESTVRRRQLYYDKLDQDALERMRVRLVADLDHISRNINGDFDIAPDAKEFMDAWYRDNADAPPDADSNLSGYFERKPAHIHKIAMLLHLTYSDDLIITMKDFKDAIKLLQEVEVKLPETFQAMGRNPYTLDLKNMAEYVKVKGRVSERELKRKFFNSAARPEDLDGMIQSLIDLGRISMIIDPSKPENQRRFYTMVKATSSNGDGSKSTHPTKTAEFDPHSSPKPSLELAQPHNDSYSTAMPENNQKPPMPQGSPD